MTVTWYDQGVQQGQRELILSLLETRFGSLSMQARARLESWPAEALGDLAKALLTAESRRELGLET